MGRSTNLSKCYGFFIITSPPQTSFLRHAIDRFLFPVFYRYSAFPDLLLLAMEQGGCPKPCQSRRFYHFSKLFLRVFAVFVLYILLLLQRIPYAMQSLLTIPKITPTKTASIRLQLPKQGPHRLPLSKLRPLDCHYRNSTYIDCNCLDCGHKTATP